MGDRKDITVPMPPELNEQIEQELDYGDSKAAWVREAIEQRLERARADRDANGDADRGATAD